MRFGYVGGSFGCGMWVEYDYDGMHDGGMWWSKCLKHDGWDMRWDKCLEHEDGMWYVIFSKSVGKSSWALGRDYWVEHDHKGRSGMWVCGWRMRFHFVILRIRMGCCMGNEHVAYGIGSGMSSPADNSG
ncbi:hypothetical protein DPMN_139926 [Dreissena polymorpha]|uniref:Uncharacterized protein n=1 Tax=Dreissena polymorpha TaxID=45954 RepID=A0A9D4G6S2_DREPO|nr:hypothetical protein DPMN_139926 [Dreissena polymorpha]